MKILTFFNSLFEPDSAPNLNPSTGAELIPGTLLDVTGHCVGESFSGLDDFSPGVFDISDSSSLFD